MIQVRVVNPRGRQCHVPLDSEPEAREHETSGYVNLLLPTLGPDFPLFTGIPWEDR